jgi:hypothetical protein
MSFYNTNSILKLYILHMLVMSVVDSWLLAATIQSVVKAFEGALLCSNPVS